MQAVTKQQNHVCAVWRTAKFCTDFGMARVLRVASVLKQVRDLHKNLTSVVQEMTRQAGEIAERIDRWRAGQVLQIAVVSDIDRRSGMHEISQQNIGVELLRRRQRTQPILREGRVVVGQNSVVLPNDAQRQLSGELVIPF